MVVEFLNGLLKYLVFSGEQLYGGLTSLLILEDEIKSNHE